MKLYFKRHGWNILLFFNIFLISLFSLEIFQMYSEADQIANQSIDGLSDKSIQFVIDTYDAVDFSFLEEEDIEFVLMQHMSDNMPVYRVIYSNHFFNIEEGRDFIRSDFINKQNVFICGSKAEEIFEVAPFVHNEEVFEKIGVLGDRNNTTEEYGIFTTEGNINEYPCYGEFILEGIERASIEQIFLDIKINMGRDGYSIIRLDKKESKISDLYDLDGVGLKILLLTMFFLGGSMLFIVYFWIGQYDEVKKVYYLLGLKKLEFRICMNYFFVFIIGFGIAMLINPIPLENKGVYTFMILCINMLLILGICLTLKRKGEWNEKNIRGNYI